MAVTQLATRAPRPPAALLAPAEKAPTAAKLRIAEQRLAIITAAVDKIADEGINAAAAALWLYKRRQGGKPSAVTLQRWLEAYLPVRVLAALAPGWCRPRKVYGWEVRVWQLYQQGSKLSRITCAEIAREEGFADATNSRVNAFLKSLPKTLTEYSPHRVGKNHHHNNIKSYKQRDYENLGVGEEWVSDGHKLKVVCRNAVTSDLYRIEITPILDVRSNYLIAWWWSRAESAETTVFAFCSALQVCGQVPVWFYSDNGSGFANHTVQALLDSLGIRHIRGIPGNKKGRGFGEGFHSIVTAKFSRRFGDAFCGDDRTDDGIERIRSKMKRGLVQVPTDIEVMARFRDWAPLYNARPQPGSIKLKGLAPIDLRSQWVVNPLHTPPQQFIRPWVRPEDPPTVQRSAVRFENRRYEAAFLMAHEGEQVQVQYDRYNEDTVWVYDSARRYLGEAHIADKAPHVQEHIAADDRERSRQATNARHQAKIDRNNDNYRPVLSSANLLDALEGPEATALPAAPDLGVQLLAQGHSLSLPSQPQASVRPLRQPSAETGRRVIAAIAEGEAIGETDRQRYQRWLDLKAAGQPLGDLASYHTSYECRAFERLRSAFGVISGITLPPSSTTPPEGQS